MSQPVATNFQFVEPLRVIPASQRHDAVHRPRVRRVFHRQAGNLSHGPSVERFSNLFIAPMSHDLPNGTTGTSVHAPPPSPTKSTICADQPWKMGASHRAHRTNAPTGIRPSAWGCRTSGYPRSGANNIASILSGLLRAPGDKHANPTVFLQNESQTTLSGYRSCLGTAYPG